MIIFPMEAYLAMRKTGWHYFKGRLCDSLEFTWWQDAVVAGFAAVIGYSILERKAAWDNFIAVVVIGLGATIAFEIFKTTWRFVWTVPRQADLALEEALDKLRPKFKVEQIIPQRTETNVDGMVSIYLQVIPECLSDAPVEECQGWLLLVSRPNSEGRWMPTEMNSPLKLGWDYYGYDPITLYPGIPQRLCICFWENRMTAVIPTVGPLPSKWHKSYIGPGPFKFDIRIKAKECAPVDFSVTVNLLGRMWDEPEYELIQGHQAAAVSSLCSRLSE